MEAPQISVVKAVDLCLAVVERRIFFMLCCLCYLWFLCMMFLRRTYLLGPFYCGFSLIFVCTRCGLIQCDVMGKGKRDHEPLVM